MVRIAGPGPSHPYRTIIIVLFVFPVVLGPLAFAAGPGLDRVTEAVFLKGRVAPGTVVMDRPLGGLSRDEATDVLLGIAREYRHQRIELRYGARVFHLRPPDLGVTLDALATLERVWAVGRTGGLSTRLASWAHGRRGTVIIEPALAVQASVLHRGLIEVAHEVDLQPVNAALDQDTGLIRPGRPGRRLVLETTERMVRELVAAGAALEPIRAELPVEGLPPRVTINDLADIDRQVIGQFTTYFDQGVAGRSHNIARAAAVIDGEVLHPGETFSFNETVGPTTAERGYEEALELFKGVFITGVGGGACQVSSTLYNSVLLAGLQVVERYNHSRVLPYVAAGRDATVNYGGADFRFRNNTSYPLQVRATVRDGAITTRFIGRRDPGPDIIIQTYDREEIKPEVEATVDETLTPGQRFVEQEGVTGLKVTVARVWVGDGVEVRREIVSRDVYPAFPEVAKVGPSPAAPEPAPGDEPGAGSPEGGPDAPGGAGPTGPVKPGLQPTRPESAGKKTTEGQENGR